MEIRKSFREVFGSLPEKCNTSTLAHFLITKAAVLANTTLNESVKAGIRGERVSEVKYLRNINYSGSKFEDTWDIVFFCNPLKGG